MGYIPEFRLIKTVCLVGTIKIDGEEVIGNVEMDAKSKKATHSINLIKLHKELALIARESGKFPGRKVEIMWDHGEEELSDWSEQKGDDFFQLVDFYEKGVIRLKRLLQELIETSVLVNYGLVNRNIVRI